MEGGGVPPQNAMKAIALSTFENDIEGLVRRGQVLPDLDARRFKALQQAGLVDEESEGRKKLDAAQAMPSRSSSGQRLAPEPSDKKAQDPQNKNRGRGGANGRAS